MSMTNSTVASEGVSRDQAAVLACGLDAPVYQALRVASTPNLANALLKRGFRNTYLTGLKPLSGSQEKLIGPAFTLRFMPSREDINSLQTYASPDNKHRVAMETCPMGAVLVIDAYGGNTRASSMGDLMAARLKARGVAGVVTDGGFRDSDGIRRTGLAAYQKQGTSPATPIVMHAIDLNVPIGCAGVAIYPGDIMVGDADGVVAIPRHLVDEVAFEAKAAEEYEGWALMQIEHGKSLMGLFPSTPESLKDYEQWIAAGRPQI